MKLSVHGVRPHSNVRLARLPSSNHRARVLFCLWPIACRFRMCRSVPSLTCVRSRPALGQQAADGSDLFICAGVDRTLHPNLVPRFLKVLSRPPDHDRRRHIHKSHQRCEKCPGNEAPHPRKAGAHRSIMTVHFHSPCASRGKRLEASIVSNAWCVVLLGQ